MFLKLLLGLQLGLTTTAPRAADGSPTTMPEPYKLAVYESRDKAIHISYPATGEVKEKVNAITPVAFTDAGHRNAVAVSKSLVDTSKTSLENWVEAAKKQLARFPGKQLTDDSECRLAGKRCWRFILDDTEARKKEFRIVQYLIPTPGKGYVVTVTFPQERKDEMTPLAEHIAESFGTGAARS